MASKLSVSFSKVPEQREIGTVYGTITTHGNWPFLFRVVTLWRWSNPDYIEHVMSELGAPKPIDGDATKPHGVFISRQVCFRMVKAKRLVLDLAEEFNRYMKSKRIDSTNDPKTTTIEMGKIEA